MTKMDLQWKTLHETPPADWREVWQHRVKVGRYDTLEQAEKALDKVTKELVTASIDIHPKDGYVIYKDLKRFEDWKGNLDDFVQFGDLVDQAIVDEFITVLPPACMTSTVVQMGEAKSHHKGRQTYHTLKKSPYGWKYAGDCFIGGEAPSIEVRYVGEDDWGRKVYENTEIPSIYKLVDGRLHTVTGDGEPAWPLRRHVVVNIVE